MTDEPPLLRRVAAVEAELALIRADMREQGLALLSADADSRAARQLAAGADRDVSELREEMRAHTRALTALRQTQVELHARTEGNLGDLREQMRAGFETMRGGLEALAQLLLDQAQRPPQD